MGLEALGWIVAAFFCGMQLKGIIDYLQLRKQIRAEAAQWIEGIVKDKPEK